MAAFCCRWAQKGLGTNAGGCTFFINLTTLAKAPRIVQDSPGPPSSSLGGSSLPLWSRARGHLASSVPRKPHQPSPPSHGSLGQTAWCHRPITYYTASPWHLPLWLGGCSTIFTSGYCHRISAVLLDPADPELLGLYLAREQATAPSRVRSCSGIIFPGQPEKQPRKERRGLSRCGEPGSNSATRQLLTAGTPHRPATSILRG